MLVFFTSEPSVVVVHEGARSEIFGGILEVRHLEKHAAHHTRCQQNDGGDAAHPTRAGQTPGTRAHIAQDLHKTKKSQFSEVHVARTNTRCWKDCGHILATYTQVKYRPLPRENSPSHERKHAGQTSAIHGPEKKAARASAWRRAIWMQRRHIATRYESCAKGSAGGLSSSRSFQKKKTCALLGCCSYWLVRILCRTEVLLKLTNRSWKTGSARTLSYLRTSILTRTTSATRRALPRNAREPVPPRAESSI